MSNTIGTLYSPYEQILDVKRKAMQTRFKRIVLENKLICKSLNDRKKPRYSEKQITDLLYKLPDFCKKRFAGLIKHYSSSAFVEAQAWIGYIDDCRKNMVCSFCGAAIVQSDYGNGHFCSKEHWDIWLDIYTGLVEFFALSADEKPWR
jgi:hypothetical protein